METPRRTLRRRIRAQVTTTLNKIRRVEESEDQQENSDGFKAGHIDSSVGCISDNSDNPMNENIDTNLDSCEDVEITPENSKRRLDVKEDVKAWALKHNITHAAVGDLLKMLQEHMPYSGFPSDPRTLLKTPRRVNIEYIEGGQLYHFGIESQIEKYLKGGIKLFCLPNHPNLNVSKNIITLKVGIDGLPISKSSNLQFWPILASIDQAVSNKVFPISLFYGETKPVNVNEFLRPFVEEMKYLEVEGIMYNQVRYEVRIRCIVADAPARSFIK